MTIEEAAKKYGSFPELTPEGNRIIHEARAAGFAAFYPAMPNATTQANNTLADARKWLARKSI